MHLYQIHGQFKFVKCFLVMFYRMQILKTKSKNACQKGGQKDVGGSEDALSTNVSHNYVILHKRFST